MSHSPVVESTPTRERMMGSRERASRQDSMEGESMHIAWPMARWRSDERLMNGFWLKECKA